MQGEFPKMNHRLKALILIIEDNSQNILMIKNLLKDAKYELTIVNHTKEAWPIIKKKQSDLILINVIIAQISNYDFCKQLKSTPETKDIPILLLSKQEQTNDLVQALKVGAADYIPLPCVEEIFFSRINTYIELRQKTIALKNFADTDSLTNIANRQRFNDFLSLEWRRCLRVQLPITLLMIDIDYFNDYNETYGIPQGDDLLKKVADTIKNIACRPGDLIAHYGSEEFSVVLANTDVEGAAFLAEKFRSEILSLKIPHASSGVLNFVTASIGVATIIPGDSSSTEKLIKVANQQLYKAKNAGRNQVR